ncbi:MAG: hypothetical protein LAP40_10200 [Acidobacteriia bacterium]|nr:hypothetical protein [Terriglobia bacterium]
MVLVYAVFAAGSAAAEGLRGARNFAGVWEARFDGTVICTLQLQAGETMSGALRGCSIQVNQQGELIPAAMARRAGEECPIQNIRVQGQTLSFEVNSPADAMKFELVMTGEDGADLRFVRTPIKIQPIHFERRT